MVLLYIVIGMWVGVIFTYIEWYRPMKKRIVELEEGMHDCIKAGLIGHTEEVDEE